MRRSVSCVLVAACLYGCQHEDRRPERVADDPAPSEEFRFSRPPVPGVAPALTPLIGQLQLPDSVRVFRMELPSAIAASAELCLLAVGDPADRAVHLYDLPTFRYVRSLRPRDVNAFGGITSVAIDPSRGHVLVADLRGGDLWRFALSGELLSNATLPPPPGVPGGLGSQIVIAPDGRVFETWFALERSTPSADWGPDLPLIRQIDDSYAVAASYGGIRPYRGQVLTASVNRGLIAVIGDTVWFARRSDATLMAFDATRPGVHPVRSVRLPIFFVSVPRESAGPWRHPVVDEHIRAFAVDGGGRFYLGQVISWPTDTMSLHRPKTMALTVVSRTGERIAAYDLGSEILDLAVVEPLVIAVLRGEEPGKRLVRVYHLTTGVGGVDRRGACGR